ncbi:PA14 domain-containing protein [Shimia abyssi]|uniref:PA14 domain-containing protein n=1 Tax=Shimia abyssi TaxID=1662395 RepID=A0A2P8FJE5_9RHOB|nr:PA14 domain-containing protein [Shimia abyssi]PSL21828.1 PA14 domain-containing protein [Shimia abyssi]
MRSIVTTILAGALAIAGGIAMAQPIQLTPANPQPSGVKKGLKVSYFTGERQVRTLSQARSKLKWAKPGKPLAGLNYPDKGDGAPVLTAGIPKLVVADINGYIKFDKPGIYKLEFFSNDGSQFWISGKEVAKLNMITACASAGRPEVSVPQAGWYDFKALYWQKEGTACLESEWTPPGGKRALIPNSAFGYK